MIFKFEAGEQCHTIVASSKEKALLYALETERDSGLTIQDLIDYDYKLYEVESLDRMFGLKLEDVTVNLTYRHWDELYGGDYGVIASRLV